MEIDPRLLAILACPACESRPAVHVDGEFLRCELCGNRYPVVDGIPDMLISSAIAPDAGAAGRISEG